MQLRFRVDSTWSSLFSIGLPNSIFLTSSQLGKGGLQRVIHKYRNGGAHDSPISDQACRGCVERLVGSKDSPGCSPALMGWGGVDSADEGVNADNDEAGTDEAEASYSARAKLEPR